MKKEGGSLKKTGIAKACSITAAVLMILVIAVALPLTVPKLFGISIYNLLTPSMEPAMSVGSAVYTMACAPETLQPGEIVCYEAGEDTALVQTHRVVENDSKNQQLITKGDANAETDAAPVSYDRVIGKVVCSIPMLGAVSEALHAGGGIAVCIAIFAMAFILWTLADKIKKESFK